jgi:hypothetical protein
MTERVLYLMITGAGPAKHIEVMVNLALDAGWSIYCVASPAAVEHFLDLDALEQQPRGQRPVPPLLTPASSTAATTRSSGKTFASKPIDTPSVSRPGPTALFSVTRDHPTPKLNSWPLPLPCQAANA